MILMPRSLVILATLLSVIPRAAGGQTPGVLHIQIVLVDAERKATPVARHALLISDNPSTAPPRRIVTSMDGAADVRLPPGNYTVESDQPVAFQGKAYQWTQNVDIVAGRDAVLELTTSNAEVEALSAATSIEVQITPTVKVAARILVADSSRDVAVLWIDPTAVASVRPVPLGC